MTPMLRALIGGGLCWLAAPHGAIENPIFIVLAFAFFAATVNKRVT